MGGKSTKRAIRRHHRDRLKQKRRDYYGERWRKPVISEREEKYWCVSIDTPTPCSCCMCGNPRRHFNELTPQERRHNESWREECQDLKQQ